MHYEPINLRQTALGCTLILSLALGGSQAWAFAAVITACHDGDTCSAVTADGQRYHVRLHGVDAPELDQPFGTQSRALVTQLVVGHHVDVRPAGRSHDRLVADLRLRDGRDVGGLLVAAGAAWVEPGYTQRRPAVRQPRSAPRSLGQMIRRGGLGFSQSDPTPRCCGHADRTVPGYTGRLRRWRRARDNREASRHCRSSIYRAFG
jgi:endonuclease YncB( thermonuclease family)